MDFILGCCKTIVLVLILVHVVVSGKCGKCKFGGRCVNGNCLCNLNCRKEGWMPFCGVDGRSYINYCQLQMHQCESQREIPITCLGTCDRCLPRARLGALKVCKRENNFCLHGGVCIEDEFGRRCRCKRDHGGQRCEIRHLIRKPKFSAIKGSSTLMEQPQVKRDFKTNIVFMIILVFFSALFSAIVMSAICRRYNLKKLQSINRKYSLKTMFLNSENNKIEETITL